MHIGQVLSSVRSRLASPTRSTPTGLFPDSGPQSLPSGLLSVSERKLFGLRLLFIFEHRSYLWRHSLRCCDFPLGHLPRHHCGVDLSVDADQLPLHRVVRNESTKSTTFSCHGHRPGGIIGIILNTTPHKMLSNSFIYVMPGHCPSLYLCSCLNTHLITF